jgi:ADP-ribose pyrophosphatase
MDEQTRERVVSSQTVFAGRLISVRVDQVQLPSGIAAREVVSHPGAVGIVPLLPDGRVVMIRQYRHAVGEVLWELPAGTLQPGEDPEACARRELIEEVGYRAGEMRLLFSTYLSPGYADEVMHVFLATDLVAGASALEEDERIEPVAMPLAEAVAKVRAGEVRNATAICGLLAAAQWAAGEPSGGSGV